MNKEELKKAVAKEVVKSLAKSMAKDILQEEEISSLKEEILKELLEDAPAKKHKPLFNTINKVTEAHKILSDSLKPSYKQAPTKPKGSAEKDAFDKISNIKTYSSLKSFLTNPNPLTSQKYREGISDSPSVDEIVRVLFGDDNIATPYKKDIGSEVAFELSKDDYNELTINSFKKSVKDFLNNEKYLIEYEEFNKQDNNLKRIRVYNNNYREKKFELKISVSYNDVNKAFYFDVFSVEYSMMLMKIELLGMDYAVEILSILKDTSNGFRTLNVELGLTSVVEPLTPAPVELASVMNNSSTTAPITDFAHTTSELEPASGEPEVNQ